LFKAARARWKIFGDIMQDNTGRAFSLLFYYTMMIPFGAGMRLLGDPLQLEGENRWLEREPVGVSLEEARRQG
jgi:hypothetical protein